MFCLLLPPPLQGHRCVIVVCEGACSLKKAHNPPLSSSSSPLHQPSKKEETYTWTKQRVYLPPRLCSLNEFSGRMASDRPDFFSSLSAIIELSAQVQNWEVLSGRLAMMVFTSALVLEALTGSSVFGKMDSHRLVEYCGATFASILVAAGFAVALQAKSRVAYTVSKGYEKLINGFTDNVIDSLLFDNEEC